MIRKEGSEAGYSRLIIWIKIKIAENNDFILNYNNK